MAVPNRGQLITAAWEDYVKTDPENQVFNQFWILENMKQGKSFRKGGGDPITGTIEYAVNTTVKAMSELETMDTTRVDVFDRYEAPWKFVGGNIVMSEFEKQVTANGAGKFDLEAGKIENLKNTMLQKINTDLYSDGTGESGKQISGLQALVATDPTTGTVEQINRGTYSFWRNQQTSGAKSSTVFDNLKSSMRSIYNLCSSGPGMNTPEYATTDRATFEGFESLSTTIERLNRTSANDTLYSGYKGDRIMFKDINLAFDFAAPAGNLYILNRQNLMLRYLLWMKPSPPASPVNQFIDVVKIQTIYNLITDNPRRLGVVSGIT